MFPDGRLVLLRVWRLTCHGWALHLCLLAMCFPQKSLMGEHGDRLDRLNNVPLCGAARRFINRLCLQPGPRRCCGRHRGSLGPSLVPDKGPFSVPSCCPWRGVGMVPTSGGQRSHSQG